MLDIQVPATWPSGAKIVIVGEAPGREEVEWHDCPQGHGGRAYPDICSVCQQACLPAPRGWIGAAGRCMQKAAGLAKLPPWGEIALSNVAKRRPKDNKFYEEFYETIQEPIYTPTGKLSKRTKKIVQKTSELQEWYDLLESELQQHQPNLIVAAGNAAMEAIVGYSGISNYRGSIVESRWQRRNGSPFKVLCVEHPSYIIRGNMTDFWILAHDLEKARRTMHTPQIENPDPFWSISLPHQINKHTIIGQLKWIMAYPDLKWSLDVETRAGTLACYSVAYRQSNGELAAFAVPIQTPDGPYWSPEDEIEIWEALAATATANPNLCNQNVEYDIYYLLRYGVEPSGVYMDTMLAHSILYPEFPKGLDFLCSWYLDHVIYYKGEGRNWTAGDRDPQLWEYCCKDSAYTLQVMEKQDEELRKRGMWESYHGKTVL